MPTPRQYIDGALGNGWYDEWQKMQRDTASERQRTQINEKRFRQIRAQEETTQLFFDGRLLEQIAHDYDGQMNALAAGHSANTERVKQIHDAYTLILGVIREDNNAVDCAYSAGIFVSIVGISWAVLQLRAKEFLQILELLSMELKKAQIERNDACAKTAISAALTAILALFPEITAIGAGVICVSHWIVEEAFFGHHKPAGDVAKGTGVTIGRFGEAVERVPEWGKTTRTVAKAAGKTAVVVGFYFDGEEILHGYRRVEEVKSLMARAKSGFDSLVSTINAQRPAIRRFLLAYAQWQKAVGSYRKNAEATRDALREELKESGYKPGMPMAA